MYLSKKISNKHVLHLLRHRCINILTLIGNTSLLYDIELFKYQRKNKTTNPTNFQSGDAAKVAGKNPRNCKFRQVTVEADSHGIRKNLLFCIQGC